MIKYRPEKYSYKIKPVDCISETSQFVKIRTTGRPRTERKFSKHSMYFNTWDDAYVHLRLRAKQRLDVAETAVEKAKKDLKFIESMVKPEG